MFCTPDLLTNQGVVEIETSWDATTFPFFEDEAHKQVKKGAKNRRKKTGAKNRWENRVANGIANGVVEG